MQLQVVWMEPSLLSQLFQGFISKNSWISINFIRNSSCRSLISVTQQYNGQGIRITKFTFEMLIFTALSALLDTTESGCKGSNNVFHFYNFPSNTLRNGNIL